MPGPTRLPRVAVLLSTYNGERFLDEQLASLRAQEGVEVLLHVRDDGSTDRTCEILARHAGAWPSLADLRPGCNLGAAASFLELLRTAPDDADYYAFCDQDDVWLPGKLERAVAGLAGDAGPALYCSNVTCVAEDLRVLGAPPENGDASFEHFLFENIAYGCTVVMNSAARARINSRLPTHGLIMHDWWCALVIAAFGRVRFDPESRILYRQHGANSIGAEISPLARTLTQARILLRRPDTYYRIHAQSCEFLRLYGEDLEFGPRAKTERLVQSKRSLAARARYAFSSEIVRSGLIGSVAARGLMLAGWY